MPDFSRSVSECIYFFGEEIAFSVCEIDGERGGGSGYVRSSVFHWVGLVECWAGGALAQPTGFIYSTHESPSFFNRQNPKK